MKLAWVVGCAILYIQLEICFVASNDLFPVILIPGLLGSRLEVKLNRTSTVNWLCKRHTDGFEPIWATASSILPLFVDCLVDNMKLFYDPLTGHAKPREGVIIRPEEFGSTQSVSSVMHNVPNDSINQFRLLISKLEQLGYQENVNIFGAPFDWRLSPFDNPSFASQLKELIDSIKRKTGKPVVIISFSLGGLYALDFLYKQTQQWKDEHIKLLITLSTPWLGSINAVDSLLRGYHISMLSDVYGETKFIGNARSYSSVMAMMPHEVGFKQNFVEVGDEQYRTNNYTDLFKKIGLNSLPQQIEDSQNFLNNFRSPQVDLLCIHASHEPTKEKIIYQSWTDFPNNPEITYGDGDGTVNRASLAGCLKWKGQGKSLNYKVFPNGAHDETVKSLNIVNFIVRAVQNIH